MRRAGDEWNYDGPGPYGAAFGDPNIPEEVDELGRRVEAVGRAAQLDAHAPAAASHGVPVVGTRLDGHGRLFLLGIEPGAQDRGPESARLAPTLAEADRAGAPRISNRRRPRTPTCTWRRGSGGGEASVTGGLRNWG